MKRMPQLLSLLLCLIVSLLLATSSVRADGMLLEPDPYADRWDFSEEGLQEAFIYYQDGVQRMIISVEVADEVYDELVWLFPVPAAPDQVTIDTVTQLPALRGEELSLTAQKTVTEIEKVLRASQLYPLIYSTFADTFSSNREGLFSKAALVDGELNSTVAGHRDLVVHEHLEKDGLVTEIVTTQSVTSLSDYLAKKGSPLEADAIPVLGEYLGKDYSFVVSWISNNYRDSDGLRRLNPPKARGIFVSFPSKKIYYPLMLTSVYDNEVVPASVRVFDYVKPEIFADIQPYTEVKYYSQSFLNMDSNLASLLFADGRTNSEANSNVGDNLLYHNIRYSKIDIQAPSKLLTQDLWIKHRRPLKTYYSAFFAHHSLLAFLLMLLLSSLIAGLATSSLIFKWSMNKSNLVKYSLLSSANCLTFLGLVVATALVSTLPEKKNQLLVKIQNKGYFWKRRLAYILFFIAVPSSLVTVIFYLFGGFYDYVRAVNYNGLLLWHLPIIILTIALAAKKIPEEDEALFQQLKAQGYSTWTFQKKDRRKWSFVALFSLSFLLISFLLLRFIESTV